MFRNTSENAPSFEYQSKVFPTSKLNASPLQPKSYTPIRARLQGASGLNSTPITSKLSNRTQSPLLNRILSKQNVPMANNLLTKSPSKQITLSKPRLNDSQQIFGTKSPLKGIQQQLSSNSNWRGTNQQYFSNQGITNLRPSSKILMSKNSSLEEQNILQSKGLQNFGKKNSIQSGSPLLAGLINKRQSNIHSLLRPNQQYDNFQKEEFQDNRKKYSTNAFSKFKNPRQDIIKPQKQQMCMNNDNKKAKYQVINSSDEEQDTQIYYYCAKCAIHLIQQGFKVQQISTSSIIQQNCSESQQLIERFQEMNSKIVSKQSRVQTLLKNNQTSYQNQFNLVDTYYNSLIDIIESYRSKDKQNIISSKQKSQRSVNELSKKLQQGTYEISTIINQLSTKPDILSHMQDSFYQKLDTFDSLLIEQQIIQTKEVSICEGQLQDKYDHFCDQFQASYSMNIIVNKIQQSRQAVSFSFEMPKLTDRKISPLQQYIPEQQDRIISEDQQIQQTKQPFRNLFPDESQSQSMQFQGIKPSKTNEQISDMMSGLESDDGMFNGFGQNETIQDQDDILIGCTQDQSSTTSPSFKKI